MRNEADKVAQTFGWRRREKSKSVASSGRERGADFGRATGNYGLTSRRPEGNGVPRLKGTRVLILSTPQLINRITSPNPAHREGRNVCPRRRQVASSGKRKQIGTGIRANRFVKNGRSSPGQNTNAPITTLRTSYLCFRDTDFA